MIIDSGIATGSLTVSGSLLVSGSTYLNGNTNVTGNLSVSGLIIGTISGSSTTASYAVFAQNAATASLAPNYLPLAGGTVAGNLNVQGTASIAYLNVTFESASVIYSSGSNILGDDENDTQTLYGTVIIPTGSLEVTGSARFTQGIYSNVYGTASYAGIALNAFQASQSISSYNADTASLAVTASYALTASYAANVPATASYALQALSSSYAVSASSAFITVSGSNISSVQTDQPVSKLQFDSETGLNVDLISGSTAFISIGSHYKYIFVSGSETLIATGSDEFTAVGEGGIEASTQIIPGGAFGETKYLKFSAATMSGSLSTRVTTLEAFSGSYNSGSFSGSFQGNGSGLTDIPASGIVGLNLSQIASGSATASIAPDKGFLVNTNTQITGSLQVTQGITGSFSGSLYNLQNTVVGHIPFFSQSQILTDSAMFQVRNGDGSDSIVINQNGVTSAAPEALFVFQNNTSSFNVISGKGNLNSYLQLNIQNNNNGTDASSDVVATANNGNESVNFVDMGINGANFVGSIGGANDAYLYSTGNHLHIGNASTGQYVGFFAGGPDVDTNMKMILSPDDYHQVTGSIDASQGFIGNLTGNADTATTASNALTASSADNFLVRNDATVTNTLTAQTLIVQTVTSSIVYSSGSNIFGNQLANTQQLTGSVTVTGSLAVNGFNVINSSATASMTVLSASYAGTASYALNVNPNASASYAVNSLTASYAQTAPAYLTTASYLVDSASFSTRDTNLETTASSLVAASASFSTRVSNNEVTGSNLTAASSSFSTRVTTLENASASLNIASASFSTRDTNLEATASTLVVASASFSDRVSNTEVTASNLVTASGSFSTRVTTLENASASLNTASASFSARTTLLEATSSTLVAASASFSTRVTNNELTGSTLTSASASLNTASGSLSTRTTNLETTASNLTSASASFSTRVTNNELTGSSLVAASASFSTRVTNNELTGSTLTSASASFSTRTTSLESTASVLTSASASFVTSINNLTAATSSYATTGSNTFKGTETLSGSLKFALTTDPDPTGGDAASTFLFESASNTTLGRDLYFRQDGNITKWKWIESQLQTGLLYGGALSYSGSTIYANSGSGIIMSYGASFGSEVNPIAQYINWGPITASATYLTSSNQTYVYIDSNGALKQQTSWFTPDQYSNAIPLGVFYHGNKTNITSTAGDVATVYNTTNQSFDFIRAFGPLKLNGLTVGGNAGSMQINLSSGTSFVLGGFYQQDQNNVSHYNTATQATGSIIRVYRSGSTNEFVFDNNGGAFYTTVDNTKYDNNGVLTTVGNGNWTIQRVFESPVTGRASIYYGQKIYASLADAQAGLASDPFTESTLTAHNNVFNGYLLLQGNAANTDITNAVNAIVQSGLFRSTVGSSGGTTFGQTLESLTDVDITSVTNGQALIYNGGNWINGTPTTAATASYVLNAVSASFATTALNAPYYLLTASYTTDSASFSTRVTNNAATASNLVAASASFSTRVTNNELTGSALTTASASFSTRVTNTEATASQFITASGSLSTRTTNLESTASTLTTASASFALVSASFSTTSGSLSSRTTLLESTSSTLVNASASFSTRVSNTEVTASNLVIASGSFSTRTTNLESTASTLVNASASFSTRVTNTEATSSTLTSASASFSTRVTNTELTASSLVNASASFATVSASFSAASGSDSIRLTNLESTASTLTTASASFAANYVKNSQTSSMTVLSASYALTASYAANVPATASYALQALSSSYALTASYAANVPVTASYALTASYVLNAVSASFATSAVTASFATDFTASNILVNGTVTAQTLYVQYVTASTEYSSGSNVLGSLLTNTQQLTGSVTITGSLQVNGRTPLYIDQTSSLSVVSASYAATASRANATATTPFIVGGTATYYGTINSSTVGSNNIFTIGTGSYTAATFQYTAYSGSNSRAGQVIATWNNGTTQFTDFSTPDNGTTVAVTSSVAIISSQLQFNFQTNTSGWTIKSQGTLI